MDVTALLLADGRFPAGGHAHSGGIEASVASGRVCSVESLHQYLLGRLSTSGVVSAAFAAASCRAFECAGWDAVPTLDDELDARVPSPVLRTASRALGRQLFRAARCVWPGTSLGADHGGQRGVHHPVALGVVAASARIGPTGAASVAAYDSVAGPAAAAVRLLGLDPFAVHRSLAALAATVEHVAAEGAAHTETPPYALPSWSAPLLDIAVERFSTAEVRLFAS